MKILVKAKVQAKKESVERLSHATQSLIGGVSGVDTYKVSVTEPAVDGKANKAIIKALSKHFEVPQSCIEITSGQTSKTKHITITE